MPRTATPATLAKKTVPAAKAAPAKAAPATEPKPVFDWSGMDDSRPVEYVRNTVATLTPEQVEKDTPDFIKRQVQLSYKENLGKDGAKSDPFLFRWVNLKTAAQAEEFVKLAKRYGLNGKTSMTVRATVDKTNPLKVTFSARRKQTRTVK